MIQAEHVTKFMQRHAMEKSSDSATDLDRIPGVDEDNVGLGVASASRLLTAEFGDRGYVLGRRRRDGS